MVESKTVNNKEEISYYRIFGWRKVGEYHGPAITGSTSIVSVEGQVKQKVRDIDEYYLRRDMVDRRYKTFVNCEKEFNYYYGIHQTSSARAEKFIARKTRKFAVILFTIFLVISILGLLASLGGIGYFSIKYGDLPEFWKNPEWQDWALKLGIAAGACLFAWICCAVILHFNKSKNARKLPNYYKKRYMDAFNNALQLSGVVLEPNFEIVPLKYRQPTTSGSSLHK